MLLSNFAAVRAYETWFEQPGAVPVATLHRLRIACKYLRYNLEFLANLLGPESTEIIGRLRKLQDDLGDLNDAVVSKQLLAEDQATADQKTIARYATAQEKIVEKVRNATRDDFANFVGSENRIRLLTAIGNL
jgi:CHAD domain-containing protein